MDWEKIYRFDQEPIKTVQQQIQNLLGTCVEVVIVRAKFYNSCKKLFYLEQIPKNLRILEEQSQIHFPSHFAYLVFKAIYRTFESHITVLEMSEIVKNPDLPMKLSYLYSLLQGIYDAEDDTQLPRKKKGLMQEILNHLIQKIGLHHQKIFGSAYAITVNEDYLEDGIMAKTFDHEPYFTFKLPMLFDANNSFQKFYRWLFVLLTIKIYKYFHNSMC